ncbi:MAG: hypothetical protein ACTS9Y_00180 [Methylophilus sp.]|uniref:hypothetical protein n=1 Tax=Methylophilus sp. TaxID=29541 RepID=UPI003F9F5B07
MLVQRADRLDEVEEKKSEVWFTAFNGLIVSLIILVHFALFMFWGPYKIHFPYTHLLVIVAIILNVGFMLFAWHRSKKLRELGL